MRNNILMAMWVVALGLPLTACNEAPHTAASEQTFGPSPVLPAAEKSWIPTVNIASAKSWPAGGKPKAASGMSVNAFAAGLEHPRTLHVLPNGDVLVAETNAPPKPDDGKGIRGALMKFFMKKAGAVTPSANRITLLRDANGDGVAETRTVFMTGLNSPFGMALVGDALYIANTDAVVKVPYRAGDASIAQAPVKVADLPGGPLNHHWTKNLLANRDGSKLYVTVGSNSNIGENGMEVEQDLRTWLSLDQPR